MVCADADDATIAPSDAATTAPAAKLIRGYEQMERDGIDLGTPYTYKMRAIEKSGWGKNASITAGVGALAILGAFAIAAVGRKP